MQRIMSQRDKDEGIAILTNKEDNADKEVSQELNKFVYFWTISFKLQIKYQYFQLFIR